MFKGFGSSISSGLSGLGSSLGNIGSSIMNSVSGLGSSLSVMFSKGMGSLSSGLGNLFSKCSSSPAGLGNSLLDGAKKHGPGLLKSGLKSGLNIGQINVILPYDVRRISFINGHKPTVLTIFFNIIFRHANMFVCSFKIW